MDQERIAISLRMMFVCFCPIGLSRARTPWGYARQITGDSCTMSSPVSLPRLAAGAALALSIALGACDDSDPVNPDPHANVQSVVLEVEGGETVTFNAQRVASGELTIGDGSVIAVTFRDSDDQVDAIAQNPDNFELRVNFLDGNPAGLIFTPSPTNPFAGTFTRATPTAPGSPVIVQLELYHITGTHQDGRWNVLTNVE